MRRFLALESIVANGSFTKAAQQLGYTQSAITQMINSLESEIEIKLLVRSRKGAYLTIEGKELYPYIQQIILQEQLFKNKTSEIKGLVSGTVRIGSISSVSIHWLPQLINTFMTKYPKIQFHLYQGNYDTIPEWVRTNYVDFGFTSPDAVHDLETKFLKYGDLKAVFPVNHPLAKKEFVTLEDVVKEPLILSEEGAFSEPLEEFKKVGLKPNVIIRVFDDHSILSMVENNMGYHIAPELVLRKTSFNVKILPIKPNIKRKVGLVMKNKESLPIASKIFIEYLLSQLDILPNS